MLVAGILYAVAGLLLVLSFIYRTDSRKAIARKAWLRVALIFMIVATTNTIFIYGS